MSNGFSRLSGLAVIVFAGGGSAFAADQTAATRPASAGPVAREVLWEKAKPAIEKALRFQAANQRPDGGWKGFTGESDPAITAMVAQTFVQDTDYGPRHPIVEKALRMVLSFRQPDGGIYDTQIGYRNYTTSVVLMSLSSMKDPGLSRDISSAQKWLKDNQWTEGKCDSDGKPITPSHPWYGGAGYGQHKRPDLSNTQMMLEALHQSGLPANDPTYQKALRFVMRCQMLERSNDQPLARGATDGGFIYTSANGGESMADTVEVDGKLRLRSYGSMTYAGFKSMLYAEINRDDPRVKAAWDWIRGNYTLTSNPNMPGAKSKQGLYYYYHVFAKALEAWGEPFVVAPDGARHDWRAELVEELLRSQRPDGSWVNDADRWQEGNPSLVTAYSVLALQAALR